MPVPAPRPALTDDETVAWKAIRLRLSQQHPWVTAAVFRATPVAINTATVTSDRHGHIYCDFGLEPTWGMPRLCDAVLDAIAGWLQDNTVDQVWHLTPEPGTNDTETVELADLTATRFLRAHPNLDPRHTPDSLRTWNDWAVTVTGRHHISWQTLLSSHLRQAFSWQAGATDYTYSRPSRRHLRRVALPAMRHPKIELAVIADVSGSMHRHLDVVGSEVFRVATASGTDPHAVTVVACDDTVLASHPATSRMPTLPVGTATSTDLRVGIDHALTLRPHPAAIVVITDGFTPWPDTPPAVPVIVALVGTPESQAHATRHLPNWVRSVPLDLPEPAVTP